METIMNGARAALGGSTSAPRRKARGSILLLAAALSLQSCVSLGQRARAATAAELARADSAARLLLSRASAAAATLSEPAGPAGAPAISPAEAAAARKGLAAFIAFAGAAFGEGAFRAAEAAPSLAAFRDALLAGTGMTVEQIGFEAMLHWNATSTFDYSAAAPALAETAHFRIRYYSGSPAAEELPVIAALAEAQVARILGLLGSESSRFERAFALLDGGHIELFLPPDARAARDMDATARTRLGMRADSGAGATISLGVDLPYHNAACLGVLGHEVFHAVDFCLRLGASGIGLGAVRDEAAARATFGSIMNSCFPYDSAFGEGFAECMSSRLGFLALEGLRWGAADELLADLPRAALDDPAVWADKVTPDRQKRLVQYALWRSFTEFLIRRSSVEDFARFYFDIPQTEAKFAAVFGASPGALKAEWRGEMAKLLGR